MKKLVLLVLMVMVGLLFTLPTQADDRITINGNAYDITDIDGGIDWTATHNYNAEVLYIYPQNALYYGSPLQTPYPYAIFISGGNIEQFLIEDGIDIQTGHTSGIDYSTTVGFTVSKDEGDQIIRSDFNYLKIETNYDDYYYPILNDTNILTVLFQVNYTVDYDISNSVWIVDNNWQTTITINGVEFEYPLDDNPDWSIIKFTLINIEPDENKFLLEGTYRYWYGLNTDAWKTGYYFTENYFLKYIETHLEPFDNDDPELLDLMIDQYIEKIRTDGMTIILPTNYSVEIFVPAYFLGGINSWRQVDGQFTTINIRVPDLVLDGSYGSGELWGNTLIYTLGGVEYLYQLVDEYNQTIPPIFGFRISAEYWQITFDENGGSAVDDIYIGYYQIVNSPSPTTRSGWTFVGWTQDMGVDPDQPWDSLYDSRQGFPFRYIGKYTLIYNEDGTTSVTWILQDLAFQAIWRRNVVSIQLDLNGGNRKPIEDFNSNTLIVIYGETVNDNVYDIPFSNMVYKTGYSLVGWYQDEALTIPFNPSTPLTANMTIYAKWVVGGIGEDSPTGLNAFMDSLGLLNDVGTFFTYLLLVVILYIAMAFLKLPMIIYLIINVLIASLWLFLGWFNVWVMILVILANLLLYKFILKG